MALNGDILGEQLFAAVQAAVAAHQTAGPEQTAAIWKAIGNAIVTHVRLAQVNVTVTSVSGVTVGAGISGPGAGTGTIT